MAYGDLMNIYETLVVAKETAFAGLGSGQFSVKSGSRAVVTLSITAIDPGATITLKVRNGFGINDPFITLDNISATTVDQYSRVYADFNTLFSMDYEVTGGTATFKIAVTLNDNAGSTTIENAQLHVDLDANPDATGHHDSIRIGSPTGDELAINSDGSINAVLSDGAFKVVLTEGETDDVLVAGVTEEIVNYTAPVGKMTWLQLVDVSGENIAQYEITLNGSRIGLRRTSFGEGLNTLFDYRASPKTGYLLAPGDVIAVNVSHARPAPGLFNARIQTVEAV